VVGASRKQGTLGLLVANLKRDGFTGPTTREPNAKEIWAHGLSSVTAIEPGDLR